MDKQIIPSIIAKSQAEMEERILLVKDFVSILQLDIMDNKFVKNSSLDFDFKLPVVECSYEAHLMVNDPIEWIHKHGKKVDMIIAPIETCEEPDKVIQIVKAFGKKIGFALNPETSLDQIKDYLDDLDQVIIMTVNPGFYGSKFIPEMVEKIKELRKLKPELNIEVDGSINNDTIDLVYKAGANYFVSGSYIMKSENVKQSIENLKKKVE